MQVCKSASLQLSFRRTQHSTATSFCLLCWWCWCSWDWSTKGTLQMMTMQLLMLMMISRGSRHRSSYCSTHLLTTYSSVSSHRLPARYDPWVAYSYITAHILALLTKQARREPQRGPGKHSGGAPNIFAVPLWGENFRIFLSKTVHSGVFYISERRRGPTNVAGSGVAYPYTTLWTGLRPNSKCQQFTL